MASEPPTQTTQKPAVGPVLWGAATAVVAAILVILVAATWITLRGYPDHAQSLSVPLTDINAAAGEVEETDAGVRLIPDDRGVAIVLFDGAPRFPAFQFSQLTLKVVNAATFRSGQALWATRDAPEETRRLPLNRDGSTLSADLAESPDWANRVNGIGVALMAQDPVELESVTLRPPETTFSYVLTRLWHEWTYREGYHGYTINRLKGAGRATLFPIGLAGGIALLTGGLAWILVTRKTNWSAIRERGFISLIFTIWMLLALPWIREVWAEAAWSADTYIGKTDSERRLSESGAHLFSLAQTVKAKLPEKPQRLWLVGEQDKEGFSEFERWKLKYYLAPHNASVARPSLVEPSAHGVRPGDYIIVAGLDHESYPINDGVVEPGYRVNLLLESGKYRVFHVTP